jgi:hypothetical protein
MAKAKGPTLLHGKIQSLIFRVRNGQQEVYFAPGDYDFSKAGMAYHLNKREFAAAAHIAQDIHRSLRRKRFDELGPIFCPYPQNRITAALKKGADHDHKKQKKQRFHYAHAFTFRDTARALQGLDLSRKTAPTNHVEMIPLGPLHCPTHIKIRGLEKAAEAIQIAGNARLEFRIHIHQSRIKELQYHEEDKKWLPLQHIRSDSQIQHRTPPSDWVPTQFIPAQGITLPIPQWEQRDKYLTTILIEWREIRTVGHKIITKHEMGIVRIAATHGPAEAYQDATPNQHHGPKNHPWNEERGIRSSENTALPTDNWQDMDPEAYLKAALEKLLGAPS